MKTFHGPPERENKEKVAEQFAKISSYSHLDTLVNALPNPVLVLNNKRQIIFSNKSAIEEIGADSLSDFLGRRQGEALNCQFNNETAAGCGTSKHCQVCGTVNTILRSQEEGKIINDDCRIIAGKDGDLEFYNYQVSSTPIYIENEQYLIVSLIDNTSLKKKEMLEKLFYHDILNTAGNIQNLFDLVKNSEDEESKSNLMNMLEKVSKELVDEIQGQRHISSAETGDLNINIEMMNSIDLLNITVNQFNNSENWNNKVNIDSRSSDLIFNSDRGIISRILKNMIKNALEACEKESEVQVSVIKENRILSFKVNNPEEMPEDIKLQIFQKSFSTKSHGRGFGTYSMKLLGEKYLDGKVHFTSNKKEGTTFVFDLPI